MRLLGTLADLWRAGSRLSALARDVEELRLAIGRQESRRVRAARFDRFQDAEFKVFSQWGEDGLIQYLIGRVPIETPTFVELGVQDYSESNTRFLLCNDAWGGLILDAGTDHLRFVADRGLDWRYDLRARSAFVTRENVNEIISDAGFRGDVGLLSIDIDGNDYWILDAIRIISPRILVVEYQSTFGPDHAITVPYRSDFRRERAHASHLYYGASLRAICDLAAHKGYVFVGCNSAGANAFFVRKDVAGGVRALDPASGYVASRFCESRGVDGRLTFVSDHRERLRLVAAMPVVEVPSGRERTVAEVFDLHETDGG